MRYWRTIQADCSSCHGRGDVMIDEIRAGEFWCSFVECHGVEHHHDDEMKAFLAAAIPPATCGGAAK